ncbi:MAG: OmpA family protein [Proteobacteria bacterium]|nr:OmpA family protein [Pseudomonadota bacterium]
MKKTLLAASAVTLLAALAGAASAQQQLRQPRASVEVDWSVLDELNQPPAGTPALRPPRGVATNAGPRTPAAPLVANSSPAVHRAPLVPPTAQAAPPPPAAFTPPPPPPSFPTIATAPAPAPAPSATLPPPPPSVAAAPVTPAAPRPVTPPPAPAQMASAPPPPPPPSVLQSPQPLPAPAAVAPPPPAPAAPAPAAAAPEAPAPQIAAAPPATRAVDGPLARLPFNAGSADIGDAGKAALAPVVAELQRDATARLQLQAYASGGDDQGGQARRLSLSRALAVRGQLIEQGIASTRMDVRALGRTADGPPDRVDIVLVRR